MTVGILGGGQLGRMLALAGYPLGLRFRCFDPAPAAPAGHLAEHIQSEYEDLDALGRFAEGLDVVTYEFERVPVASARFLNERVTVYPPPAALEAGQDRLVEKSFFQDLRIPTPPFLPVDSKEDLANALDRIGFPAVLKTRRFGYDGKGQAILRQPEDAEMAWETLGKYSLLLEGFVQFEREVSVLAIRGRQGETAFYPVVENHHRDGMLRLSLAPAPGATAELQAKAQDYATRVLDALDYVGVLALEFFQKDGQLVANEMAPRVHNSGHWTIEGAETSQFENHLRAILGLPLGSTDTSGYTAMVNIVGTIPDPREVLQLPGAHLHLYGKSPAPSRKLGHITLRARNADTLHARLAQVRSIAG